MSLVRESCPGFLEFSDIHPNQVKSPSRSAIATRKPAPDILMRINKNVYAMSVSYLQTALTYSR